MIEVPERIKSTDVYIAPLKEINNVRLFLNENLFGPSPKCLNVFKDIKWQDFSFYPANRDDSLKTAISEKAEIDIDCIAISHGSSESLKQFFCTYIDKYDIVMLPNPGWKYYESLVELTGGNIRKYDIMENICNYRYSVDEINNKIEKYSPKVVVITSPNMPTGNKIYSIELESLVIENPDVHFLIDEAYWGFDKNDEIDIRKMITLYDNISFVRTFSKFFGLASERIGYFISNKRVVEQYSKYSPLFGISYLSQNIAKIALEDDEYYKHISESMMKEIEYYIKNINVIDGYKAYSSSANFILISVPIGTSDKLLRIFDDYGITIRECNSYCLESKLRITIGPHEINKKVVEIIESFSKEQ